VLILGAKSLVNPVIPFISAFPVNLVDLIFLANLKFLAKLKFLANLKFLAKLKSLANLKHLANLKSLAKNLLFLENLTFLADPTFLAVLADLVNPVNILPVARLATVLSGIKINLIVLANGFRKMVVATLQSHLVELQEVQNINLAIKKIVLGLLQTPNVQGIPVIHHLHLQLHLHLNLIEQINDVKNIMNEVISNY